MIIIDRIKELIAQKEMNETSFAKSIGLSQRTLNNYMNGRSPSYEAIDAILRAFPDVSAEWLLMGEGEMYKSEYDEPGLNLTDSNSLKYYYELDATASNIEDLADNELDQPFRRLYIPGYEGTIGFTVTGESMLPTLKPRDIVAVSREMVETIINGEMYLVVTRDGQRMVKRLVLNGVDEDGIRHIKCVSDNPNQELYAPFEILGDNIHTISRVRGYISYSSL